MDKLPFHRVRGELHFDLVTLCVPSLENFFSVYGMLRALRPSCLRDRVYRRHYFETVTHDYVALVRTVVRSSAELEPLIELAEIHIPEYAPRFAHHHTRLRHIESIQDPNDPDKARQLRYQQLWRLRIYGCDHFKVLKLVYHFTDDPEAEISSYVSAMAMELYDKIQKHKTNWHRRQRNVTKFASMVMECVLKLEPMVYMRRETVVWDGVDAMLQLTPPPHLCRFCGLPPSARCAEEAKQFEKLMHRWRARLVN